jgi:hypothetical protein
MESESPRYCKRSRDAYGCAQVGVLKRAAAGAKSRGWQFVGNLGDLPRRLRGGRKSWDGAELAFFECQERTRGAQLRFIVSL